MAFESTPLYVCQLRMSLHQKSRAVHPFQQSTSNGQELFLPNRQGWGQSVIKNGVVTVWQSHDKVVDSQAFAISIIRSSLMSV